MNEDVRLDDVARMGRDIPAERRQLASFVDAMSRNAWGVFFLSIVLVVASMYGAEVLELLATRVDPYNATLAFLLRSVGQIAFASGLAAGAAIVACTAAMRGEAWGWKIISMLTWVWCCALALFGLTWLGLLLPPGVGAARALLESEHAPPYLLGIAIVCPLLALWGAWELGSAAAELPPVALMIHRNLPAGTTRRESWTSRADAGSSASEYTGESGYTGEPGPPTDQRPPRAHVPDKLDDIP